MREQLKKAFRNLHWLPALGWQQLVRRSSVNGTVHLVFALADHFEPSFLPAGEFASHDEQERRLRRWCREYPKLVDTWRDADDYAVRRANF